jgi:hypothetical protein
MFEEQLLGRRLIPEVWIQKNTADSSLDRLVNKFDQFAEQKGLIQAASVTR